MFWVITRTEGPPPSARATGGATIHPATARITTTAEARAQRRGSQRAARTKKSGNDHPQQKSQVIDD
jgi:hypothetical protein